MGLREREARQRERVRDLEIDIEDEEAIQPRTITATYTPSPEEFESHGQTHLPYRNWRPICIQTKKKIPPHRRGTHEGGFPVNSMDYMYLNDKKDDNNLILVIHDSESEGVRAIMGQRKGDDEYIIRRATEIVRHLGYMKVIFKTDQEPSIGEMDQRIRNNLQQIRDSIAQSMSTGAAGQVVVMNSAVGESASNGRIEHAIQSVQDQIRAIKLASKLT